MDTKRINVLIYSGKGSSLGSLNHCLYTLGLLLNPHYAVTPVTADILLKEPWQPTCALLIFPGGGDLGYCEVFNGEGNRRIQSYVRSGGNFIGFCAGAYFASKRCEFEVEDPALAVIGERELGFFPDACLGSVAPGFAYGTESGTHAMGLKVNQEAFPRSQQDLRDFKAYVNGGCVFTGASKLEKERITTLATYAESVAIPATTGRAAAVHCLVGDGQVILSGPHVEFCARRLSKDSKGMRPDVVDSLTEDEDARDNFLRACLNKIGLHTVSKAPHPPTLSTMYLSFLDSAKGPSIINALQRASSISNGHLYLDGGRDKFLIHLRDESVLDDNSSPGDILHDFEDSVTPRELTVYKAGIPSHESTPNFNLGAFFYHLRRPTGNIPPGISGDSLSFGENLIYCDVIDSTNTLLEKNLEFTTHLTTGTTLTATTQLSGRGRGSNVWVSPAGSLLFSTVIKHALVLNSVAPVVFIQYLAALAIIDGVHNYDSAPDNQYTKMPIRLKWPNDIYILDPRNTHSNATKTPSYVKIGGILVNSSYSGGDYTLVVGVGLNVSNAAPTISLNTVLSSLSRVPGAPEPPPYTAEKLLARILVSFGRLYGYFVKRGFTGELERMYYKHWLHQGQIVTLEVEGGAKAKIEGITRDWGLLLAEEVAGTEGEERPTGKKWALQSDSNSFDFFTGLIRRKI